jgi:hypothetical protein
MKSDRKLEKLAQECIPSRWTRRCQRVVGSARSNGSSLLGLVFPGLGLLAGVVIGERSAPPPCPSR